MTPLIFKSVKFRLTVWYTFVLALLLSLFGFFMYAELHRVLYKDMDDKLFNEAMALEDSMKTRLNDFLRKLPERRLVSFSVGLSPEQFEALKDKLMKWEEKTKEIEHGTLGVRFVGLDHTELLSNLSGWQKDIIFPDFERDSTFMESGTSYQTIHYRKRPIRLYYHLVTAKNYPLFIIQIGAPLTEVNNSLQRLFFIILISIPGAVLAACIAGWFLAKRSFRPIDSMIREARQITAAYLQGRLPRSFAKDEVDRLAETLNEMMDRIESSTRAIQDFSSDISHELRTPLAIIRGEIDLALRRSRSTEDLIKTFHIIEEEVNELIRLVDDLMLLVRSDAKQLSFEKKKVALKTILEIVSSRFKERALAKSIQLEVRLPVDASIKGDELYLKRLFSNLLDNAIKFTLEGGRVSLSLRRSPTHAIVEVADTGMGIELEVQAKVFSRFYRTDQARSHEGAGLGLNIAKAISDGHNGEIKIESKPGAGTLVTIFLPLA